MARSMSFLQVLAGTILFFHWSAVVDAGNICSSLNCFDSSDNEGSTGPYAGITCPNPKAPKSKTGWNIYKAKSFPTVAIIAADLRLCGIATATENTNLFYSYGGGLTNAKRFGEASPTMNVKNINTVMPQTWYDAMQGHDWSDTLASTSGQPVWVARSSQALASVATGKVYLIAAPTANIYTVPFANPKDTWIGAHNVWYDYEFRTLQKNTAVTGIYTVNSETLAIDESATGSWVRGRTPPGADAALDIDADTVTPETIQAKKAAAGTNCQRAVGSNKRANACTLPNASSATGTSSLVSTMQSSSTSTHTTLVTSKTISSSTTKATTTKATTTKATTIKTSGKMKTSTAAKPTSSKA